MAAPSVRTVSTGGTDATGAWTATCHAPAAADRIIILQFLADGTNASVPTISSTTNIKDLAGTSGQWTRITAAAGEDVGSAKVASQHLYIGRSTSTSAPVVTGANAGGDDVYYRFYEFVDVSTGTTLATVIENGTAGSIVNGANTSATISDTGVTTLAYDRLACNFVAINDDNAQNSFSGETGGSWISGYSSEYADSAGTDGAIGFQTATMTNAGTINGGSFTQADGTDGWGVVGFALIGTTTGTVSQKAGIAVMGIIGGGTTYTKANAAGTGVGADFKASGVAAKTKTKSGIAISDTTNGFTASGAATRTKTKSGIAISDTTNGFNASGVAAKTKTKSGIAISDTTNGFTGGGVYEKIGGGNTYQKANAAGAQVGTDFAGSGARNHALGRTGFVQTGLLPFPQYATSVTDDFNRANADPIDGNWYTTGTFAPAKLVSNHVEGPGFEGGEAGYTGSTFDNFEVVWEVSWDLNPDGFVECYFRDQQAVWAGSVGSPTFALLWDSSGQASTINAGIAQITDAVQQLGSTTVATDITSGDFIGYRRVGSVLYMYHQPLGGSWSLIHSANAPNLPATGYVGFTIYEDSASPAAIDNFRVASVTTLVGDGMKAAGADAITYVESGTAKSEFAASGADASIHVKTGAGIAPFFASGTSAETQANTGTAISEFIASGADAVTYVEAGLAKQDQHIASGVDAVTYVESGIAISIFAASGTSAETQANTGTAISEFVASGANAITYVESGAGVLDNLIGASFDADEYHDTGAGVTEFKASGAREKTSAQTGTAAIDMTASGTGVALVRKYPVSDISVGTWHPTPLYPLIADEDDDYIESGSSPGSPDICEVRLEAAGDPGRNDFHSIQWRIDRDQANGDNIQLTVRLVQGTSVIASWTRSTPNAFTTYEETLTEGEAASITDYSDLRLRFEAVKV